MQPIDEAKLAAMIDHTLLKPEADRLKVQAVCEEAAEFHIGQVCIAPCWVRLASEILKGTGVTVCTVVGFPLGSSSSEAKAHEACVALEQGAREIDMVMNIGLLKSGLISEAGEDIAAVRRVVKDAGGILKVIIETCLLTHDEKLTACDLVTGAGADFIKTSTGFSSGGATVEDVRLLRARVGQHVGVKASGGIRTLKDALAMIEAGANRLGTSAGAAILRELRGNGGNRRSYVEYIGE